MNKRVYGMIGIASRMSNWNADFSGYPKMLSNGQIFSSDKALKYAMKVLWEDEGQKVLSLRSHVLEKGAVRARILTERFGYLFDEAHLKSDEYLKDLFTAMDVKQFGLAFAVDKKNISVRGAVQIGQGLNVYEHTEVVEQPILSPYANSRKQEEDKKATMTSIGTKIVTDEAHYMFPFVVNPHAYDNWVQMGVTAGYSEEDYQAFKKAALKGVTGFASCARSGCDNEFALFVETDDFTYLPDLSDYVHFTAGDINKIHVDVDELLKTYGSVIQNIEVYYDPKHIELSGCDAATVLDIRKPM